MFAQMLEILLIAHTLLISGGSLRQQPGPPKAVEVTIQISSVHTKVAVGAPINLLVSITNAGERGLLVGRNLPGIQSDAAYVTFLISDRRERFPQAQVSVADRFTANTEAFVNAVMETWVAIPPKCSYSFPVDVRTYAPEFFEDKGFYKVQAVYSSTGIRTQITNQHLNATDEDIKKLPFAAWEGTTKSNELWIEIVTR